MALHGRGHGQQQGGAVESIFGGLFRSSPWFFIFYFFLSDHRPSRLVHSHFPQHFSLFLIFISLKMIFCACSINPW